MSRRYEHTPMGAGDWQELCEWLDAQPRKCVRHTYAPPAWAWLFVMGSPDAAEARRQANWPIFYQPGWGWRLKRDWRERLAAPPASYVLSVQGHRTVPGAPQ